MSVLAPLLLALCAGAPYADTRGRFALTLPDGWTLAPRFGDTSGMRFARTLAARRGGRTAHLGVEVREEGAAGWPAQTAQRLADEGFSTRERPGRVGGRRAVRVTATRGSERIDCRFLDDEGVGFRLCLEGEVVDLRLLREEVKVILRSFRGPPAPSADPPMDAPAPERPAPTGEVPRALLGAFESGAGTVLVLEAEGRYRLGDSRGRFEVQGQLLELRPERGAPVAFTYEVDPEGLTLRSARLSAPARYRRRGAADPPELSPARIAGRWQSGEVVLVLEAGGAFSLGSEEGQWMLEDGLLRLRRKNGDTVSYSATLKSGTLRVSGADLDRTVTFRRVR